MPLKMPFAVLKFLVILALFMALEVSARELLETSNSLGPYKMPMTLKRLIDDPWGHHPVTINP
ncbi:hypothetical protein RHGRI_003849 [Rhododendron griersonianum]|uniref:Uncharacterized protein n=1 Tax=Rhododendron griersonianum TaxID=479676 RepID=A0AAV6L6G4_9ERIC|nr:hypothetical protein RHGRI_003849 [Rhododendron griersonianum]